VTRRVVLLWLCLAALAPALPGWAAAGFSVECPGSVERGQAFFVRVHSDTPIKNLSVRWLDREFAPLVYETGQGFFARMLLGVGLDAPAGHGVLHVIADTAAGRAAQHIKVAVKERAFAEQRLTVDQEYVEPPAKALERNRREQAEVRKVLDEFEPGLFLECPLERPVDGEVGSEFGLRRFFNGQPRSPHSGVDLRAAEGEPVRALAAGRVALAAEHYFSGRSVFLDHGQGVVSMYFHLSEIDVAPGQFVAKGQVIGKVGATGRVTGPHLHFGLSVLGQRVDPLGLMAGNCAF
jgi:murein DD-endopeptidase MepM/ murein hydrolase activator NlpD